jgi:hypothetical protein
VARLAVALVLALIVAFASVLVGPLVSLQPDLTERGWPLPWLFQQDVPGSSLPIIGWIFQSAEAASTSVSVLFFFLDFAVFSAIFLLATGLFARNDSGRRRVK